MASASWPIGSVPGDSTAGSWKTWGIATVVSPDLPKERSGTEGLGRQEVDCVRRNALESGNVVFLAPTFIPMTW